jgi:hypothetical protein
MSCTSYHHVDTQNRHPPQNRHPKSTPTQNRHPKPTPKTDTQNRHPKSTPKIDTQNRHPKSTRGCCSRLCCSHFPHNISLSSSLPLSICQSSRSAGFQLLPLPWRPYLTPLGTVTTQMASSCRRRRPMTKHGPRRRRRSTQTRT